ncbi:MAG: thiamine phosphate synthase [Deltaproteobacteria bacterium]|nr:thiamine phosphate synthase [Deltaproteobacteria bacterium]
MTLGFRLLAITPPTGAIDPATVAAWSGAKSVGLAVLLRDPGTAIAELVAPAHRFAPLRRACADAGIPCLLSVPPQVDASIGAVASTPGIVGCQLRGDPTAAQLDTARAHLPAGHCVGRSCHGTPPALGPRVDYSVLAPIFAPHTTSAGPAKVAVGLEPLVALCARQPFVFALGGLTAARGEACLGAGAWGLAGIRSFFGVPGQVTDNVARWVDRMAQPADHAAPPRPDR